MPFGDRLTAVLPPSDPLGRSAARWAGVLTARAGQPIPYAFALAVARQLPAPGPRKDGRPVVAASAGNGATG
ncbi:MAG: hypothetical protein ACR2ML_07405 [Solirubrobacteraceae bacterium]